MCQAREAEIRILWIELSSADLDKSASAPLGLSMLGQHDIYSSKCIGADPE